MTLIRLSTAWLVGIVLADRIAPGPVPVASALALVGAVGWAVRRRRPSMGPCVTTALCLVLGAARLVASQPVLGPGHVATWNERGEVAFVGRIAAEPERKDRSVTYRVAVEAVRGPIRAGLFADPDASSVPAHGTVLVQAPLHPARAFGDRVEVVGELVTPPVLDGFDYRDYLARRGIHSLVRRPRIVVLSTGGGNPARRGLIAVRERGRRALAASLPEPEASLVTGIVLGDDGGLPEAVADAFRTTGTSHVIAISGSNIAVLIGLLGVTLVPLAGRRRAAPIAIAVVAGYAALVGADAAVVRAAIMGVLTLVAGFAGRPGHAATALFAAAWGMTVWSPHYVWDVGFQLSFAATLGLIAFAARFSGGVTARLERRMPTERARAVVRVLDDAVLVTLAAQLTTWPIIAAQMHEASVISLAANALILPAQPAVMILGGLTAAAGAVAEPLGRPAGVVAWLPTTYTIRVVEAMARVPHASIAVAIPGPVLWAYYAALALVVAPRDAIRGWARRALEGAQATGSGAIPDRRPATAGPRHGRASAGRRDRAAWPGLALLAVLCGFTWVRVAYLPDGLLHVHQLDVGQGDAILVVTPNGRRMLVDGGPSPNAVLAALGRHFAPWDRRIDVVVATHPDADHVGGLPTVLERYAVGAVVDPGIPADTPDAAAWAAALARGAAPVHPAGAGGRIVLDSAAGVEATLLWPAAERLVDADGGQATNDNSVVLRLTYGAMAVLLTGDIEAEAEARLVATGASLAADVLKVAHHGSGGSSTPAFLAAVGPRLALIGVGAENRYGHPSSDTLARLGPIPIARTDLDGEIEVMLDGREVWLRR